MNPLPPLPLVDGCLILDNTALELLQTCNRAMEYNKLWKRVSVGSRPALDFGSAIHLALEWRYKRLGNDSPTTFDEDEQAMLISKFFSDNPPEEGEFRNAQFAVDMIRKYNSKYQVEPFNIMKFDKPMPCSHCHGQSECLMCNSTGFTENMVELPFLLPLYTATFNGTTIPVMYSGKIDLPVLMNDQLIVTDHKTTSMMGGNFFEELRMSAQPLGYCWAMQTIYPNAEVGGFMINGIRAKEIPQYVLNGKSWKGMSPDAWWEESFQRDTTYLRPGQLDEWKHNAIALVEEFFWAYGRGYMPMKTKWCHGKYGRCPYVSVCSLPPEQRGLMLASTMYQENKWSPLNKPSSSTQ